MIIFDYFINIIIIIWIGIFKFWFFSGFRMELKEVKRSESEREGNEDMNGDLCNDCRRASWTSWGEGVPASALAPQWTVGRILTSADRTWRWWGVRFSPRRWWRRCACRSCLLRSCPRRWCSYPPLSAAKRRRTTCCALPACSPDDPPAGRMRNPSWQGRISAASASGFRKGTWAPVTTSWSTPLRLGGSCNWPAGWANRLRVVTIAGGGPPARNHPSTIRRNWTKCWMWCGSTANWSCWEWSGPPLEWHPNWWWGSAADGSCW